MAACDVQREPRRGGRLLGCLLAAATAMAVVTPLLRSTGEGLVFVSVPLSRSRSTVLADSTGRSAGGRDRQGNMLPDGTEGAFSGEIPPAGPDDEPELPFALDAGALAAAFFLFGFIFIFACLNNDAALSTGSAVSY
ncbi:unnamed protein product [Polarella glacialis]|uniref:Uncharacterized protein n=1 Tax=Polarella glacialis TaxID=89957 RepID=A0A813ETH2_POLGL|nr:unnamed protein product [Polarella glacialis]CAE8722848.1 unnamed protein product [Polarella glacialis]|eukprot:CAMPEP_0115084130 /NCGR_PEP_ID=MMETSP0227-20121206/21039_1 /TAXON_ID=89957 /ORGANISM="Polarella glacialis, Strain CCMP 1383" /LENGTH=136 /DNA_ID=CAMNT_0002472803 /DNA_START=140 /DNA_END=550 /DNA_ORIENTATION=-